MACCSERRSSEQPSQHCTWGASFSRHASFRNAVRYGVLGLCVWLLLVLTPAALLVNIADPLFPPGTWWFALSPLLWPPVAMILSMAVCSEKPMLENEQVRAAQPFTKHFALTSSAKCPSTQRWRSRQDEACPTLALRTADGSAASAGLVRPQAQTVARSTLSTLHDHSVFGAHIL